MSPLMLGLVIQLCSNFTVENINSTWSNPKEAEIYRLECIEYYKDCPDLNLCISKRLESLKPKGKL